MGMSWPGPNTYAFLHHSHNAISARNVLLTEIYAHWDLNTCKMQLLQPD